MTLIMKQEHWDEMVRHARAGLPNEACGLIAGTADQDTKTIQKVYLLSNPDHSAEHFSIDPQEQLAAIKDMRARGLSPLGNFHSHPASPARPSEEDIRLAYDKGASYLILSLAGETPVLKAFAIVEGAVRVDTIQIERS